MAFSWNARSAKCSLPVSGNCMRLAWICLLLMLRLPCIAGTQLRAHVNGSAQDSARSEGNVGTLIVKLRTDSDLPEAIVGARGKVGIMSMKGVAAVRPLQRLHTVIVKSTDVIASQAALSESTAVEYVEQPQPLRKSDLVNNGSLTPNDPLFSELWGMTRIDAPFAWDVVFGHEDVLVAVIDTGVDYNHPDIAGNMWTNPFEIPNNGIDDDGNGYIDDVHGIDTVNQDSDPMDDEGHGTHCAGTVGAVGNNNVGVIGVSPRVSILACKFLDSRGSGTTAGAIECLNYALTMNARITSNSYGGGGFSQAFSDSISEAENQGQLFVAAAGNSADDTDVVPHYPSSYDHNIVLAVAATSSTDSLASFSSYGATTVDIGAPGVNILSTALHSSYKHLSGTSMATPHVSGAAALLFAVNPSLSGQAVKDYLMATAEPLPSLQGRVVSNGLLDVHAAVLAVTSPTHATPTEEFDVAGNSFDLESYTLTMTAASDFAVCKESANGLPDPTDGAQDLLLSDDDYVEVVFADGFTFPFYGIAYSSVFVGSNGYLTFGAGDTTYLATRSNHFRQPRVSALFTDLSPDFGQTSRISVAEFPNRVVVTYEDVPEYRSPDQRSTFQVALMQNGDVRVTHLQVNVLENPIIVGLSPGTMPPNFSPTDLSGSPDCGGDAVTITCDLDQVLVVQWLTPPVQRGTCGCQQITCSGQLTVTHESDRALVSCPEGVSSRSQKVRVGQSHVRRSESCCADLQHFRKGSSRVCGSSSLNGQTCVDKAHWKEAQKLCAKAGARLCSAKELTNQSTFSAGCDVQRRIWTGDACHVNGTEGFVTLSGLKEKSASCSASGSAGVICCADPC